MKIFIIDRFEGDYAVCEREDKSFVNIPKSKVPLDAKEGDCLVKDGELYKIDYELTNEKKNRIQEQLNKLMS